MADASSPGQPEPVALSRHGDAHVVCCQSPDHIKAADRIFVPQHNQLAPFDSHACIGEQVADIVGIRDSPAETAERDASFQLEFRCHFAGTTYFFSQISHILDRLFIDGFVNTGQSLTRRLKHLIAVTYLN